MTQPRLKSGPPCKICNHGMRAEIERELLAGVPTRRVAEHFGLKRCPVYNHFEKCMKPLKDAMHLTHHSAHSAAQNSNAKQSAGVTANCQNNITLDNATKLAQITKERVRLQNTINATKPARGERCGVPRVRVSSYPTYDSGAVAQFNAMFGSTGPSTSDELDAGLRKRRASTLL